MNDWKEYEYGIYKLDTDYVIFYCYSWKPMVPKGIKIDYSSRTNIELYSNFVTHLNSDVNYYEVAAKLQK